MVGRRSVLFCVALAAFAGACNSFDGVEARYGLERLLWKAQMHERKININFLSTSQQDLEDAIEAFNGVVAVDPLDRPGAAAWDQEVVADINRITIVSKIALANLYFLAQRYYDAVDHYSNALGDAGLQFEGRLDVRLSLARSMYLAGEDRSLETHCAAIVKEITESEQFWRGQYAIKEVFLNIPLVLLRIYSEQGETEKFAEFSKVTEQFYTRMGQTWPDSLMGAQSGYAKVQLYLMHERWSDALAKLDIVIDSPFYAEQRAELLLLKGEILGYGMGDAERARVVFAGIESAFPGSSSAWAARFNTAMLDIGAGRVDDGLVVLAGLENDDSVAREIRSRAMLARALYFEADMQWDQSLLLLKRVQRLFPFTTAAIEAASPPAQRSCGNRQLRCCEGIARSRFCSDSGACSIPSDSSSF